MRVGTWKRFQNRCRDCGTGDVGLRRRKKYQIAKCHGTDIFGL